MGITTNTTKNQAITHGKLQWLDMAFRVLVVLATLFLFFVSIHIITSTYNIGHQSPLLYLKAISSPLGGFFLGLLVTALLQSSSMVTSALVALVAANSISITQAIPITIGANIGTTLTAIIVAMGIMPNRFEFRRSFAVANLHFLFNLITTLFLLPIEWLWGGLSKLSAFISGLLFFNQEQIEVGDFLWVGVANPLHNTAEAIVELFNLDRLGTYLFGGILLFVSLYLLTYFIRKLLFTDFKAHLRDNLFANRYQSFLWGFLITGGVQSSSVVTATVVPIAGTGGFSLSRVFPFIIGANIGTTLTAIIASIFTTKIAFSVALIHLVFNLFGAILFFTIPFLWQTIISLTRFIGIKAGNQIFFSFIYTVVIYFLLPLLAIYLLSI